MRLHTSPASPFGRKVAVVLHETGLWDRVERRDATLSPIAPDPVVCAANPLGKIPCLELDDGTALYDSRVICEYLDGLHAGPRLFPPEGPARFAALRLQALADGMLDTAVGLRYETFLRPETFRWPEWIAAQKLKITRALDRLEGECEGFGERIDIGTLALACALGYLDFRFAEDRWRDGRPRLAAWYARMAARPSMVATVPR
ncbi:MAG: glutathione S-transferase [Geminicoccaceae bacterium]|nr:glutathione S-transferase [Geminicoccaceae bacterium]MCX7628686.1 glutathione S-transferase [Geminicoccaceae bacterium]MDW8341612.1 glutathione S-transferase [Geminicoccaceae bacterium]